MDLEHLVFADLQWLNFPPRCSDAQVHSGPLFGALTAATKPTSDLISPHSSVMLSSELENFDFLNVQ